MKTIPEKSTQKKPFYEREEPEVIRLAKHVYRWFPEAHKLTVSLQDYTRAGKTLPGKTVAVDLFELRETPEAAQRLVDILTQECLGVGV